MKALVSRSRVLICCAMFLCVLLGVAGCSSMPTTVANPSADKLDVSVSVYDHQNAAQAPSNTTRLTITLSLPGKGPFDASQPIEGSDAKTLVCDGQTQLRFSGDSYVGDVPVQTGHYTCTYFWQNGVHSAILIIPVVLHSTPGIDEPTGGATIDVPSSEADSGVTISYSGSGEASARVVATARDFNKRTAASDLSPDRGVVTIPAPRFEASFGIGWGTITLTRSFDSITIKTRTNNAAFRAVTLVTPDQVAVVPVRWL